MSIAHSPTVQNTAKCPHGFPVGACPICSGMGGGSKKMDRDTPRKAGEMTYNECLAEWHKMVAQKNAKIQEAKNTAMLNEIKSIAEKTHAMINKLNKSFDKFMQNLENMPAIIKTPVKIILKVIVSPILNLISKIPTIIKNIQTFTQNAFQTIGNFITSVTEKLAMVYGEIKNFVNSAIKDKVKKKLKSILSMFTESENSEDDEEKEKVKSMEIKKILKSLFRIKRKSKEEKDEESIV